MTVSKIRRAQLDGQWYPARPSEIDELLGFWRPYVEEGPEPAQGAKAAAAVAPHAGWRFSGKLAAKAIWRAAKSLGPDGPELVIALGGHLRPGERPVAFDDQLWATPVGQLALAGELNSRLTGPLAPRYWRGPTDDNTIEVQLPLVKRLCPRARLWPLRVASGEAALALGAAMADLSKEIPLLILASTDLTHYGQAYGFAPAGGGRAGEDFRRENDRLFIDAALSLDPVAMMEAGELKRAACSAGAAAAAVEAARLLGAKAELAGHYASGDVMPGELSVGYAGIVFAA
jgi:AmmeMemoRadiSam system protein B